LAVFLVTGTARFIGPTLAFFTQGKDLDPEYQIVDQDPFQFGNVLYGSTEYPRYVAVAPIR
jgi:hypothetical protein